MDITPNYEHMVKLIVEWEESLGPLMFFDHIVAYRLATCTWTGTLLAGQFNSRDISRDEWESRMDMIRDTARDYLTSWAMERIKDENSAELGA